jgi:DNA-binding response OmpR family regulator
MTDSAQPTVLVVEDEQALVELYVRWLEGDYDVRTAKGGEAALEQFDEDVEVVLLDRLMPGMSGDEVLAAVRSRSVDCKVAMVTAVEPDFDVITMGFDDYLTKPVEQDELRETIRRLLARTEYADLEQELYALVSKQAVLESSKPAEELAESEAYAELQSEIAAIRAEMDSAMADVDNDEFVAMVRDLEAGEETDGDEGEGGA